MMQPVGHPESFVRGLGRRVAVHSRGDAPDADFKTFFAGTKLALWWLPEVNNMCRIRGLGSKARGDKRGAAAGRAGGLNIAFDPQKAKTAGAGGSEVRLAPANKGQKVDSVNFVTKASPTCEGALRFETASQRGHYLAYFPPTFLRVVPFLEEAEDRVLDFIFVDFESMFKFINLDEVLEPVFSMEEPGAWIELAKLQEDEAVKSHFKEVMGKPVWDAEDFQAYFEGHWSTFEYKPKDTPKSRLRVLNDGMTKQPLQEKLEFLMAQQSPIMKGIYFGNTGAAAGRGFEQPGSMPPPDILIMQDVTQRAAFFQRSAAFWTCSFAFVTAILGHLISAFRRSEYEPPVAVALGWCVLCGTGAAMMPCSLFWLGLAIGVWMLVMHQLGSFDESSHEDPKFAPEQDLRLLSSDQHFQNAALQIHDTDPAKIVISMKTLLCLITLTAAYAFLVPGIVTKMFSAKAVVGASVVLDIEKSTLGLILLLHQNGMWLAALIILGYSVLMPFAKLVVLISYAHPALRISGLASPGAVRAVQKISKWATVDVFTAGTICGLFCQPHLYLEIKLHDGFYYFMGYCVLSVIGALLIDLPAEHNTGTQELPDVHDDGDSTASARPRSPALPVAASILAIGTVASMALLPLMKVTFPLIGLDASVSIVMLVASLWDKGFAGAAVCFALVLLLVPVVDVALCAAATGRCNPVPAGLRPWFRDFAMLDVYALACVVVLSAVILGEAGVFLGQALQLARQQHQGPATPGAHDFSSPEAVRALQKSFANFALVGRSKYRIMQVPTWKSHVAQLPSSPQNEGFSTLGLRARGESHDRLLVVVLREAVEEADARGCPCQSFDFACQCPLATSAIEISREVVLNRATKPRLPRSDYWQLCPVLMAAARREVNNNEEENVDIPAPELLHSAEKVLDLGGDDPDDTVLVQRTAAARVLAGKALKGAAQHQGGLEEAGFTLPDVSRLLALPGAAGRDVLLATSCVKLLAAGNLQQQRDVLRAAVARGSTNTAAAAGTAILKTLSGGGGPADHVAATDDCVETVREVAQSGVRLPAAAALLRRMAATAKPVKLAEALLALAQKAGPGQADDLQAVAELLASKDSFNDFTPELLLEAALLSSKHDALEALARGTAAAAAGVLEKLHLEEVVKLLLAIARRRGGLPAEVKDTLRVAAEKVFLPQLGQLGSEDLAGLVLATLGHGWKDLRDAVAKELLRRLPAFPAKQLLVVTPVFLQEPTGVELIASWPKVLSKSSTPASSSQKTSAQADAADNREGEGLAPDQLVKLAGLAENQAAVAAAPKQWETLLEDVATRLLPEVGQLSAAGRAMMSSQLKGKIGLGNSSKHAALQKALAVGVLPATAAEGSKSKKRTAAPAGPDGRLSKKQRGKQTRAKKS
ncbi:dnaJ [Symbiodinium natans]|uniref:DnaJ protein n=1 Tax=Symbiodinium natans TaxID=878477 RepID=A0A812NJ91_9DINO|nr:dnaJ [Symbiodinium natans]